MAIYGPGAGMRQLVGLGMVVALSLLGCGSRAGGVGSQGIPPSQDAGPGLPPESDAGTADAGLPADAGADAGLPEDGGPDAGLPMADGGVAQLPPIDAWRELVIVDSSVVLDARASSAEDGAWSFRRTAEQLSPDPARLIEDWLQTFHTGSVGGRGVDDRPGVDRLLAAWPRASDGSLDLSRAPFRLIAIASRLDLATSAAGEGRLIYGLVDPATGEPGLMTVAFEYALPPLGAASDRQAWAARWHALGNLAFGPAYNAALQALTESFAKGSALAQVRTNEAAFGSPWELREWKLQGGRLQPVWTAENPDQTLNGSPALAQFILDHQADIRAGRAALPKELLGGTALETGAWRFPGQPRIDEPLRHAFAMQTCNGCHSSETFSAQGFFHVNPLRPITPGGNGQDRLSEFLRGAELRRRADHLAALVAGATAEGTGAPTDPQSLPADAPKYAAVQVPAPEDSAPVAIDSGRVLGNSDSQGPWIYDGSLRYLMPADARAPVAQGFNARGDVVGYFSAGGGRQAFVLSGGAISQPGTLGGGDSAATLINDSGLVAGDSTVSGGSHHGFFVRGGIHDLGSLGGDETFPFAISAGGLITGQSQLAAQRYIAHAFAWNPASGAMTDLGTLGGLYSRGQTIDDAGFVTGFSTLVPSDEKVHAFTWDGANLTDLGSAPGFPWSAITGRNPAGVMVGNIYDVPSPTATLFEIHAFVYAGNSMVDLNAVTQSPLVLRTAMGIDQRGNILCTDGQVGAAHAHALLLRPR
jgi:probable HAF family extracellular repeat protein